MARDTAWQVLEAAREQPWSGLHGQQIVAAGHAYRRGDAENAAIVLAVNTAAQAREALRATVKAFHDAGSFLSYGHEDNMGVDTRRLYEAYKQARAALAAMEGV
jgi:predicted HAD superfamily Cof-like phosphohydrolase